MDRRHFYLLFLQALSTAFAECPASSCRAPQDIVLVVDASGSVAPYDSSVDATLSSLITSLATDVRRVRPRLSLAPRLTCGMWRAAEGRCDDAHRPRHLLRRC